MSDRVTFIPMDIHTVAGIVDERDQLESALAECAQAATKAAREWLVELDGTRAELSAFETALINALGLQDSTPREAIVEAAVRAWRYTRGHIEGVLVDEGVTELPGAWAQDDGPPTQSMPKMREPRVFESTIAAAVFEVGDEDGRVWSRQPIAGEADRWRHGPDLVTEMDLLASGPVFEVIYEDPVQAEATT